MPPSASVIAKVTRTIASATTSSYMSRATYRLLKDPVKIVNFFPFPVDIRAAVDIHECYLSSFYSQVISLPPILYCD